MKPKTERTLRFPTPFVNLSVEVPCEYVGPYPQPLFCMMCGQAVQRNGARRNGVWHANDDPEWQKLEPGVWRIPLLIRGDYPVYVVVPRLGDLSARGITGGVVTCLACADEFAAGPPAAQDLLQWEDRHAQYNRSN